MARKNAKLKPHLAGQMIDMAAMKARRKAQS